MFIVLEIPVNSGSELFQRERSSTEVSSYNRVAVIWPMYRGYIKILLNKTMGRHHLLLILCITKARGAPLQQPPSFGDRCPICWWSMTILAGASLLRTD